MSNIIPFDSGSLPSYIKAVNVTDLNNDLAGGTGGFPVVSIKGKVFAIVRNGERNVLTKMVDGEAIPAPSIDAVLVKANKNNSKVFYARGYQEGAENTKPDCFSNDGIRPDASIEAPQAKQCATCPHNQWGSKIGDNGGKGKACQDTRRIAIATPDLINDPYLLRVPPASLKGLFEYTKMLQKRGVGYNMVVTRVGFDMEAPTPKLTFRAIGFLTDAAYQQVQDAAHSDIVADICGVSLEPAEPSVPAIASEPAPTPAPAPKAEAPASKPAPKAAPKPAPKAEPVEDIEVPNLNLSDLNFDD